MSAIADLPVFKGKFCVDFSKVGIYWLTAMLHGLLIVTIKLYYLYANYAGYEYSVEFSPMLV